MMIKFTDTSLKTAKLISLELQKEKIRAFIKSQGIDMSAEGMEVSEYKMGDIISQDYILICSNRPRVHHNVCLHLFYSFEISDKLFHVYLVSKRNHYKKHSLLGIATRMNLPVLNIFGVYSTTFDSYLNYISHNLLPDRTINYVISTDVSNTVRMPYSHIYPTQGLSVNYKRIVYLPDQSNLQDLLVYEPLLMERGISFPKSYLTWI